MRTSYKYLTINQAVRLIKKGGVVAYPTETCYGLGTDPRNSKAIEKIFKIKQRDRGKPIFILVSSVGELKKWVKGIGTREKALIKSFWPGPLTLVFKARNWVPKTLTGGTGKLGVRISSHPVAQKLCVLAGGALTSTSANKSGEPPAFSAQSALKKLGKTVDGIVSKSKLFKSKYSTILDISTNKIKVIREGEISLKSIEKILYSCSAL